MPVTDKYLHTEEDNAMNTFNEQDDLIVDDKRNAQRDIIRHRSTKSPTTSAWQCVISADLPNLHDRSKLWRRARDHCDDARSIGCRLAAGIGNRLSNNQEKLGCGPLRGQTLPCAIANAGVINATDVTAD